MTYQNCKRSCIYHVYNYKNKQMLDHYVEVQETLHVHIITINNIGMW